MKMNEKSVKAVQFLIDHGKFDNALKKLDGLGQSERCAHWNYMKGVALTGKGWYLSAEKFLEKARELDPDNEEYRKTIRTVNERTVSKDFDGYEKVDPCRTNDEDEHRRVLWGLWCI